MNYVNKKLLFITWDGPYVTYMEGLFLPILDRLQDDFEIHVVQFSWRDEARKARIEQRCQQAGIKFTHFTVGLRPIAALGKFMSLWRGAYFLLQYINMYSINMVMPRSTMPARMIQMVRYFNKTFKIVFDADGLPIEERVEFAGLKVGSLRYKVLKRTERNMLNMATVVLTRAHKAADYLSKQHHVSKQKFAVVSNGRDTDFFKPVSSEIQHRVRHQLSIPKHAFVMVYVGSLGPQYGVAQMLFLHQCLQQLQAESYLVMVVTNPQFVQVSKLKIDARVRIVTARFDEMPSYLSMADVGLAIRKASPAMIGVAPIKLGEYLLTGLPVVASAGIGDTEELLKGQESVFILRDYSEKNLEQAAHWIERVLSGAHTPISEQARQLGESTFSLDVSVAQYKKALLSIYAA